MASGSPMMNGDISCPPSQSGTLEDTLQQMNILIQENRDLKEALRQTNLTMKERFEGLSTWREKQQGDRHFLEQRLEEARTCMEALTVQNQELTKRIEEGAGGGGSQKNVQGAASSQSPDLELLRAQVSRLQAEKNDLVALNSELQLKAEQDSQDDSFIEIISVSNGANKESGHTDVSMMSSRLDNEEVTVSQLLQSLRNETQRGEKLQVELQACDARIKELERKQSNVDQRTSKSTQTETSDTEGDAGKKAASEVDNLKCQTKSLFTELQQAQSKLDEAEGMKRNMQDRSGNTRCREMEQDVASLKAQLGDKHTVQTENDRLKLQLNSMQAQSLMEQRKASEERNNLSQLKDAYTKLFEDYNELKEEKKKREVVEKESVDEIQQRLTAAEEALAVKQTRIDEMKQEIYQKEQELETISVFQAQAEVYSSDFYAERAAREKIHEEKERLATQLEYIKKQNMHLQDEMESLGRQSLNEMQRRHVSLGGNAHEAGASLVGRGGDWQREGNIPEHACPKCNEILPDLDSLQIHIMDCIN